jgi:DNA-binding LacI/PurR family transcriptional regulator
VGTVSRVLNDSPRVRPDKRTRVLEAIADLGFVRNPTAHSLSTGRSHAIGVIAPFFTSPSSAERLRGVSTGVAEHGYRLLLVDVETPQQRASAFSDLAGRHAVEGVIVVSIQPSDAEIASLGRPLVLVDAAHDLLPYVAIDDVRGGALATEHLLGKGHTRIAFVGDRLRVPDDVAVIGFDDIELAAVVGLTTVRQPLRESGRRGAELLLAAIEGVTPPAAELEALAVVERRTT